MHKLAAVRVTLLWKTMQMGVWVECWCYFMDCFSLYPERSCMVLGSRIHVLGWLVHWFSI